MGWTAPGRTKLLLAALALIGAACARGAVRMDVTPEQLQQRMEQLKQNIYDAQQADGTLGGQRRQWTVGQTALGILALRAAGVADDEPRLRRAADAIVDDRPDARGGVYERGLRAMALAGVDPAAYRQQIEADAQFLIRAQTDSGGWGYGDGTGRPDNSNSQFALLGLNVARDIGVPVPDHVWQGARRYYRAGQHADGGWGYTVDWRDSYGSMTAAGVASLYICDLWLHVSNGRCGVYFEDRSIDAGLAWLARNFSVTRNPNRNQWKFYYLYALERVGSILARRYFGQLDWYRRGVEHLVGDPERVVEAASPGEWDYLRDCYMLLFLAKGNAPIVIHKASWTGRWNSFRYDARFLVGYVSRQIDQPLDWQIVPLDASLEQLMAAPILYISGNSQPILTPLERQRLQRYVEAGGFVFVDAVRGNADFDRGFRRLVGQLFPEEQLEPLPPDHPVYTSYFDIPPADRPPLQAVKGPCWISVLYAPQGLACPWDVAAYGHVNFKMGTNIVAYVTGLQKLEGKLTRPEFFVPEQEPIERRGAFTVGQVVHGGEWRPHKMAWRRTLEQLSENVGLTVYSRPIPVRLTEDNPFAAQMLYVTGVRGLDLTEEELETLRLYVERGGFIFVEAACGSTRFDEQFRALVEKLFPDASLQQLPLGHPLLELGAALGEINYSPAALQQRPGLRRPHLEYVERGGRTVLVYSRFDLSSAVDGHPCYQCPSVLEPTASRLLTKIILYGLAS